MIPAVAPVTITTLSFRIVSWLGTSQLTLVDDKLNEESAKAQGAKSPIRRCIFSLYLEGCSKLVPAPSNKRMKTTLDMTM